MTLVKINLYSILNYSNSKPSVSFFDNFFIEAFLENKKENC